MEDPWSKSMALFNALCKTINLEVTRVCTNLSRIVMSLDRSSDMKYFVDLLSFVCFLQRSWDGLISRLEITMTLYRLDYNIVQSSAKKMWEVNTMLNDVISHVMERINNLTMHWCRFLLFQELPSQAWNSDKNFLQDRRCSYSVMAWSIYIRGLIFDFRSALTPYYSRSFTRELLISIIAQGLGSLTARYLSICPSRVRLPQYLSDIGCIVVTTLTAASSLRKRTSGANDSVHDNTSSVGMGPLETGVKLMDYGHNNAVTMLR